jgi:hypothetical protein
LILWEENGTGLECVSATSSVEYVLMTSNVQSTLDVMMPLKLSKMFDQ